MENLSELTAASTIGARIREWRTARELSLSDFAAAIGMAKGKVSEMERDLFRPGVQVALRIEELSQGAIDAGDLNDDVRAARHAVLGSAEAAGLSSGKTGADSRQGADGQIGEAA